MPKRFHPAYEMLNDVLEDRGVELVINRLALSFGDDQAGGTQDSKVP
jgi:hypothetical protein